MLAPAIYRIGPDNGRLQILTDTAGPAARAGHALTIAATAWSATLTIAGSAADHELELTVDPRSLVVEEGRGGASPLSDEDRAGIGTTIADEILGDAPIEFSSTEIARHDDHSLSVSGVLKLAGVSRPISVIVQADGATLTATIRLHQTDFGIKPYSVLFGTLKVADELTISFDVTLAAV
jgi:YceI-like domain